MKSCVCSACPLSPSHHSDVTFSSTKRNTEPELPQFIDPATQTSSLPISCDARCSQLKIPQGLGRAPRVHLNQKSSSKLLWLEHIRLSFQEALGGMTAHKWPQGMEPTPHLSHPSQLWEKLNIWSCLESSLLVSCAGYGASRCACGAMVI